MSSTAGGGPKRAKIDIPAVIQRMNVRHPDSNRSRFLSQRFHATMIDAFICDALRTPFGRYGGALSGVRADDLGAIPMRALLARHPELDPAAIEDVIYGCANQAGEDNRNVARM